MKKKKKEKNLLANIGYSMINQMVVLIVPLLTAPYIARVFDAEIIGKYTFALANSSYFVLLESLGFPLYGQMKIAANRDEKNSISHLFFEIMTLKVILMILSIIVYSILLIKNEDVLQEQLCCIMIINIVASGIDVTWFLNGIEEFKTTAIRSILVRIINIIGIFLFVKSKSDLLVYAIIMQGTNMVANVSVYPVVLKRITWKKPRRNECMNHISQSFIYFVPGLVNTLFSSTDKTMLGVLCNNYEVGIYEQANKVSNICMSAISGIGNVLLPRSAYIYHNSEKKQEANILLYKSFNAICFVSTPIVFGILSIADEFVPFFFGPGYEKSIIVLSILAFNVGFTASSNLIGQQCLISRDNQKGYNISIIVSVVVNILLNFVGIYLYMSVGAALASVVASIVSFSLIAYMSRNTMKVSTLFATVWKYIVSALMMFFLMQIIKPIGHKCFWGMIVHVIVGGILYLLFLFICKEEYITGFFQKFFRTSRRI